MWGKVIFYKNIQKKNLYLLYVWGMWWYNTFVVMGTEEREHQPITKCICLFMDTEKTAARLFGRLLNHSQ